MSGRDLRGRVGDLLLGAAERAHAARYVRDEPETLRIGVYRRPTHPRWGWGRPRHSLLLDQLEAKTDAFMRELELVTRYGDALAAIDHGHRDDFEPCWTNPLFIGIDGASLYAYLRDRAPARYLEIGSGYSTRFAARAKRDGSLQTEIVSIDPEPRVGIDRVCDRVIREPLERADLSIFDELSAGDIVFFDGSHRVLIDNDVVVFFLEVLPRIPPGVRFGVHDIFLPDDYSPEQLEEFWTEQYMLGVQLLADPTLETVLPCHYVASTSPTQDRLDELWARIGLAGTNAWGSIWWADRRA